MDRRMGTGRVFRRKGYGIGAAFTCCTAASRKRLQDEEAEDHVLRSAYLVSGSTGFSSSPETSLMGNGPVMLPVYNERYGNEISMPSSPNRSLISRMMMLRTLSKSVFSNQTPSMKSKEDSPNPLKMTTGVGSFTKCGFLSAISCGLRGRL